MVCYVNNNSFVAEKSFDGMRKHLAEDFDIIYVLELGGNVRKNPNLSGTTHNVFGIQVGVSINLFVRLPKKAGAKRRATIHYHAVPLDWRREQKYDFLEKAGSIAGVKWRRLRPDEKHNWLTNKSDGEFAGLIPIGSKQYRARSNLGEPTIFRDYSLGVSTNRDAVVYGFDARRLARRVEQFADKYNAELDRWRESQTAERTQATGAVRRQFVRYEQIKWSETLKRHLVEQTEAMFDHNCICESLYRPFARMSIYYAPLLVDRPGKFPTFFPTTKSRKENVLLCVNVTVERPFTCIATNLLPNLVATAGFGSAPIASLVTHTVRTACSEENIPLFTLQQFQEALPRQGYRARGHLSLRLRTIAPSAISGAFAENLKRELPSVPLFGNAVDFHAFAEAGRKLVDLHVNYEQQKQYQLKRVENPESPLDWRVEGMKVSRDRTAIHYNDFLTLAGVPPRRLTIAWATGPRWSGWLTSTGSAATERATLRATLTDRTTSNTLPD